MNGVVGNLRTVCIYFVPSLQTAFQNSLHVTRMVGFDFSWLPESFQAITPGAPGFVPGASGLPAPGTNVAVAAVGESHE